MYICANNLHFSQVADNHSPDQRHQNMAAIHSASTKPELKLRHSLWREGFRYRVNDCKLPGKPDIVLPRYRTVVFVHGCFWHGHNRCKYYTIPKTNTDFWVTKIARNQERDQEVWRQLEAVFDETIVRVKDEVLRNGESFRQAQENRKVAQKVYSQEQRAKREREVELMAELVSI